MSSAGSDASPLLSAALATAGEGVTSTMPDFGALPPLPVAERGADLEKMNGSHRLGILQAELLKGLEFSARDVAVYVRNGAEAKTTKGSKSKTSRSGHGKAPPQKDWDRVLLTRLKRPANAAFLNDQLAYVFASSDLRRDRLGEIFAQQTDVLSFFGTSLQLGSNRKPWTMLLLDVVVNATVAIHVQFKHALPLPRPVDLASEINPIIQTPSHSSFPSGHATEVFCISVILQALTSGRADAARLAVQLDRHAFRIAQNRTVAGVHYPVDNYAGAMLGLSLGRYFAAMLGAGGTGKRCAPMQNEFAATSDTAMDFNLSDLLDMDQPDNLWVDVDGGARDEPLAWLWDKAAAEWPEARG